MTVELSPVTAPLAFSQSHVICTHTVCIRTRIAQNRRLHEHNSN